MNAMAIAITTMIVAATMPQTLSEHFIQVNPGPFISFGTNRTVYALNMR